MKKPKQSFGIAPVFNKNLPEWSFIPNNKHIQVKEKWNDETIAIVNNEIKIHKGLEKETIDKLFKISVSSLVGKGKETVLDEKVRHSKEILAEKIELNDEFSKMIKNRVQKLSHSLEHFKDVEPILYKMVLYEEGMYFDRHIDAPHQGENHVMTLSVEIPTKDPYMGGEILFENFYCPTTDEKLTNDIRMTLFYHDVEHSIQKLQKGNRIVLVFDVINCKTQNDNHVKDFIENNIESFQKGIDKLSSLGFKRAGMVCNHTYFNKIPSKDQLKGLDNIFSILTEKSGRELKIVEFLSETDGWNIIFLPKELLSVFKLSLPFQQLYG